MVHSQKKQREIKGIIKTISPNIDVDMDAAPLVLELDIVLSEQFIVMPAYGPL